LVVADRVQNGIRVFDFNIDVVFSLPYKHSFTYKISFAIFVRYIIFLFFFVVMTSWQNILDSLPTGTGRPGTQNNNRYDDDSIQRTPNKNTNDNEGIYFYLSIK
jgi:hypothetical protein